MRTFRFSHVLALVVLAACTTKNYYTSSRSDADPEEDAGRAQDAGEEPSSDLDAAVPQPVRDSGLDGAQPDAPAVMDAALPPGATRVLITVPSSDGARVTDIVNVRMATEGASVERVDLLIDGAPLSSLALPYQLSWDTSGIAEGEHTLTARAIRAGAPVSEAQRKVIVDHTRPELVRMIPESGTKQLSLDEPLVLVFSEPIAAASIVDAIDIEAGGRRQAFTATLQADPTRVELRLLRPAPTLPATATITVGEGIRDLAGAPLHVGPSLHVSFPAWAPMGASIASAGLVEGFESDGRELWALLTRYDNAAQVTTLRAARWDPQVEDWMLEDLTAPPWGVPSQSIFPPSNDQVLLAIDAHGAPVVSAWASAKDQTLQRILKRKQPNGTWQDLPPLPSTWSSSVITHLAAEPSGALVVSVGWNNPSAVLRLHEGVWSEVGGPLTTAVLDLSVSEHGLTIAQSGCRIMREGAAGWVDLGVVQAGGGCTSVSLFARPGSGLAASVSYSVTTNNTTTTSTAILEHASGLKWRTPSFGIPASSFSAVRSRDDMLFIAMQARSVYDARADLMVGELPANYGMFVVWEGAPVTVSPTSNGPFYPSTPTPLSFFVLNHIK